MEDISKYGKPLTKRQFDAYCYCRMPHAPSIMEEVEWYSLFNNRLLGLVFRDKVDNDYGFIILGRDSRKLFRLIDVCTEFYPTQIKASKSLAIFLSEKHSKKTQVIFPQGDEKHPIIDLFTDMLPNNKQHRGYLILKNDPTFEAARNIISEIVNSFIDNDGHYTREFQSVNFQARLWELYLHIYFNTARFIIDSKHTSPDYELSYFGEKYFVEAVTVNPSESIKRPDLAAPETLEELKERLNDYMPIKFGSSLHSKLCKKYWEKNHVKSNPLILAIHDYHNDNAMTWSGTALPDYLYGVRTTIVDDKPMLVKIGKHKWKEKEIPSGFFYQEDSENISAVLFSNQATIPKFNRMGRIAGLGSKNVKMIRQGFLYNPDPNALHPIPFSHDVDDQDYEESWSDGLTMYHNPNAKYPVNPNAFSDINHVFYSEVDGFHGYQRPYEVLNSTTMMLTMR